MDEGRVYGLEQQQALLQHAYKVLEATARDPSHEMQWSWPLLGIADPAGWQRSNWAPGEAAALVAYHRDEAALEESKRKLAGGPTKPISRTPVSEGGTTRSLGGSEPPGRRQRPRQRPRQRSRSAERSRSTQHSRQRVRPPERDACHTYQYKYLHPRSGRLGIA